GLLASAFATTEFQAVQFLPLLVFPQVILGGLFMPRDEMPDVLYAISDWLPLSHAVDAIQAVAAGDSGGGRRDADADRRGVRGRIPRVRTADPAAPDPVVATAHRGPPSRHRPGRNGCRRRRSP